LRAEFAGYRAVSAAVCGLLWLGPAPAGALAQTSSVAEPEAVVRGLPPAGHAEAVALCPDISERPEVFTVRDGDGLAGTLARAGYRVYLVDPWDSPEARAEGFDGVVRKVYPDLLRRLAALSGSDRVTWIGHGLCGMLPMAAAARPAEKLPEVRWVALGTRFRWSLPSPLLIRWLRSWRAGEAALPQLVQSVFLTGLRSRSGPRLSSAPSSLDQHGDPAAVLESLRRNSVARPPPMALVKDLLRWFEAGVAADREGWVDYSRGLARVGGPALLVAGATDPVAPPEDVLSGLDAIPDAARVHYRLLSRASGDREEYGHLGMLLSRHSEHDVDVMLRRWLATGKAP
jgi:pimeloyl-ACP methyl ester carboxylesterase